MKSYTNIEQSKRLTEILPHESADYTCLGNGEDNVLTRPYSESCTCDELTRWVGKENITPCWSLTALLEVLPKIVDHNTLFIETSAALYHIGYRNIYTARANNLVDACVELIERLHRIEVVNK